MTTKVLQVEINMHNKGKKAMLFIEIVKEECLNRLLLNRLKSIILPMLWVTNSYRTTLQPRPLKEKNPKSRSNQVSPWRGIKWDSIWTLHLMNLTRWKEWQSSREKSTIFDWLTIKECKSFLQWSLSFSFYSFEVCIAWVPSTEGTFFL